MSNRLMDALVLRAPNQFSVEPVERPGAATDELVCTVDTVYICGTDPHIIAGEFPGFWPKSYPFVPGHEWSGVVTEMGERARMLGWRAGDRVCATSHCGCGYCRNCQEGRYNLCLNFGNEEVGHRQYGHYTPGAYAEQIAVSVKSAVRVPDGVSLPVAACVDPLSIALYGVERSGLRPGDDLLIVGCGAQGLLATLVARALGAATVVIVGSRERLAHVRDLGAVTIDYREGNPVESLRASHPDGFRHVFECAGTASGIRTAVAAAAKGGVVAAVGLPSVDVELPVRRMVLDEIELVGCRANPNTAIRALRLIESQRVDLTPLITHEYPLREFAEALEVFTSRRDGAVKVAIRPGAGRHE